MKTPPRILRYVIVAAVLIIIIVVVVSISKNKGEISKERQLSVPVKVMKVEPRNISLSLDYVGNIKAQDETPVYPKVSGKIIEKVKEDGSPIKKGEVIAYIDRDEVGLKFEKAPVESPLSGTVGRIYVDIGSSVTAQTAIAYVVSMDNVKTNLNIPEIYLPKINVGQAAEVFIDAYPDEKFIGIVTKVSPVVDLDTRTAPVEITIENPNHRLKSGMFAKIKLIIETHKDVPAVLKEALIGKEPNLYVYIVENDKAHMKNAKVGIREGAYIEILEGIKDGDLVVIMGQQKLRDGASVITEMAEEDYSR